MIRPACLPIPALPLLYHAASIIFVALTSRSSLSGVPMSETLLSRAFQRLRCMQCGPRPGCRMLRDEERLPR